MAVSPATRKEGTTEHFGQQGKGGLSRRGTAAAFRVRGAPRLGGALWGVGGGGGPRPVAHLSLHRPPRAVEIHVLLPRFLPVTFRLDVVDLPERSESSTERPLRRLAAPAPCGCAWAPSSQGGGGPAAPARPRISSYPVGRSPLPRLLRCATVPRSGSVRPLLPASRLLAGPSA